MSTTNIYVLRLEGERYYIGKSDDVTNRFQQHLNGNGSAWTRKYKPLSIEKTLENVSPFEEDKITKECMSKYGIDKVRGGSYVEIELNDIQMDNLRTEIWAANDLCTQCGRKGHFVKDCYAKTDVLGNVIEYEEEWEEEWECDYCTKTFPTEFGCSIHEKSCRLNRVTTKSDSVCFRCGRPGHYSSDCYATKHVKGYYLD